MAFGSYCIALTQFVMQGANTGNATTNFKAGSLLDKVAIRNALSVLGKNAGVAKDAGLKYVLVRYPS